MYVNEAGGVHLGLSDEAPVRAAYLSLAGFLDESEGSIVSFELIFDRLGESETFDMSQDQT